MSDGSFSTEAVEVCLACGSDGTVRYRDIEDRLYETPGSWSHRRCRRCGSLWLDPRPVAADLAAFYPETYFTHNEETVAVASRSPGARDTVRSAVLAAHYGYQHLAVGRDDRLGHLLARVPAVRRRATHRLEQLFPPYEPGGRLLDVGCGAGDYLALIRGYGWEVWGTEVDAVAAQRARSAHGLDVWEGTLAELSRELDPFDVVTMSHVIEHVPDPQRMLQEAAACLRPGGRLVAVTPNAGSLAHRLFGTDWYALHPPQHLALYTADGLRAIVEGVRELRIVSLDTTARTAGKMLRERRRVRKTGRFKSSVGSSRGEKLLMHAFQGIERVGAAIAPVGEELQLVLTRD